MPDLLPPPRHLDPSDRASGPTPLRLAAAADVPADLVRELAAILGEGGVAVADDAGRALLLSLQLPAAITAQVPAAARPEAYELEIDAAEVRLAAGGRRGLLWGAQTLTQLARDGALPEGRVRDWPDLAHRGLFIEDKWGPDRMALGDWQLLVDRLARAKMNTLGIGLYGCWGGCRYEGQPTEFLMVPVPGHPELKTEKRLRWYSPRAGAWQTDRYLPRLYQDDFLGTLVDYGAKRGVTVVPFVNSLGHNTMIPRLLPEVSAKDADGTPRQIGYCLSAPATRDFIEGFYGSIVERYYVDGCELFHIQLDEVWPEYADLDDPHMRVDPWCECPACSARPAEANLQDYVIWLVQMLIDKGVGKVVMWNDQLTRHMDALDGGFGQKLRAAGLTERLVLHWWGYSNDTIHERNHVAIGRELGLSGWVAPMTCYFSWERYSPTRRNIELMLGMGHDEGGEGAVAYSVHDPGWADHEILLASYAWHHDGVTSPDDNRRAWARAQFGDVAESVLQALARLGDAAQVPALLRCSYYRYSYCQPDGPWPRPYPGQALDALEGMAGDVAADLRRAAGDAEAARAAFLEITATDDLGADALACVGSLAGVAARIEALASTFAWLLALRAAAAGGTVDARFADECGGVRQDLLGALTVMEDHMPSWLVPSALMGLGPLLAFLEELPAQLAAGGQLSWTSDWTL